MAVLPLKQSHNRVSLLKKYLPVIISVLAGITVLSQFFSVSIFKSSLDNYQAQLISKNKSADYRNLGIDYISELQNRGLIQFINNTDIQETSPVYLPRHDLNSNSNLSKQQQSEAKTRHRSQLWTHSESNQTQISHHVYELIVYAGILRQHLSLYSPLCIEVQSQTIQYFSKDIRCSKLGGTPEGIKSKCPTSAMMALRDSHLPFSQQPYAAAEWIKNKSDEVEWVDGLTAVQFIDRAWSNIAHFNSRILFLHHLLQNLISYYDSLQNYPLLLFLSDPPFVNFMNNTKSCSYHVHLLQTLFSDYNFAIGGLNSAFHASHMLSSSVQRDSRYDNLLNGFSRPADSSERNNKRRKYICLEKAFVPTFMKGWFFMNDDDYPSTKQSIHSLRADMPNIPRDSLSLRRLISLRLSGSSAIHAPQKRIMLFDRSGPRRSFHQSTRTNLLDILMDTSRKYRYIFEVSKFDGASFKEQYYQVRSIGIAIGIHGANLVNSMFMPPFTVLIEIFPYSFGHGLYVNGGNAGLKYFSYHMTEDDGHGFHGLSNYSSIKDCIRKNNQCKVFYRDKKIIANQHDLSNLRSLVEQGIKWMESLQHS